MTANSEATARPFVNSLRVRPGVLRVGTAAPTITVRVEIPEVWDVVAIETTPQARVSAMKRAAVEELLPGKTSPDELVLKLRGFEVLNEEVSLAEVGAVDGSIFLATHRRRRPVR